MEKERYARTVKLYGKRNDTEAAVASAIYNGMYGKKILPYTGNRNEWTEDIDTGFHQIPDEARPIRCYGRITMTISMAIAN